jgi:SAM-dependent methyltransferase
MKAAEYDRLAEVEWRHWRFRGVRRLVHRALSLHLRRGLGVRAPHLGPPTILDVGCGCGGLMRALADVGRVVGIDSHPLALQWSRSHGLDRLVRGDAERLPFADGSFDAVVSVDLLSQGGVRDDVTTFGEMVRVSRPGGLVLLFLPAYEWLRGTHDVAIDGVRRYTRGGLRRLAEPHGLKCERLTYYLCTLFPWVVLIRWIRRLRAYPHSDVSLPPRPLNELLAGTLAVETEVGLRVRLPFGVSVFGVFRKPTESSPR